MFCLKKKIPFNTLADQELEKVHSPKHILPFASNSTQSFTENANNFLQDEANNKINRLYYDTADFNVMVMIINSFSFLHLNISSLLY